MTERSDHKAVEEAAQWFLRLQDESAGAQTFLEWQRWLTADSRHQEAYEEIEEAIRRMRQVAGLPPLPTPAELAADSYDGSLAIQAWKRRQADGTRGMRRTGWFVLAAGLAALIFYGGWLGLRSMRSSPYGLLAYTTAPGERQTFVLPEGSQITLDADSELDVALTPQQRSLRLARGEGYFQVAKDQTRPFIVSAGRTRVRAVGTQFDVRISGTRTVVAVVEGKVEVAATSATSAADTAASVNRKWESLPVQLATQVGAGQAVAYADGGTLDVLPTSTAALATTWLEGRRQYRNESLRDVLADLNRYTGRRIEVADAATGDLRFTGTLNLEKSAAWLEALSVALPVVVTENDDGSLRVALRR